VFDGPARQWIVAHPYGVHFYPLSGLFGVSERLAEITAKNVDAQRLMR
jgi:hypothetical protein